MMESMTESRLTPVTSGFALAAAVTVLFNTALAIVKDSSPPLNTFMVSLSGHQWTTHGLADLVLFAGLGFVFTYMRVGEKIGAERLVGVLIGAVAVAGLGLAVWYVLF
jgi:hypothetical protein